MSTQEHDPLTDSDQSTEGSMGLSSARVGPTAQRQAGASGSGAGTPTVGIPSPI